MASVLDHAEIQQIFPVLLGKPGRTVLDRECGMAVEDFEFCEND